MPRKIHRLCLENTGFTPLSSPRSGSKLLVEKSRATEDGLLTESLKESFKKKIMEPGFVFRSCGILLSGGFG